jgi:hypothetical protein
MGSMGHSPQGQPLEALDLAAAVGGAEALAVAGLVGVGVAAQEGRQLQGGALEVPGVW